jgi:hypothetical protein
MKLRGQGFTTDLLNSEELAWLLKSQFAGTEKDDES